MDDRISVLQALEQSLREAGRRGRRAVAQAHFEAFFSPAGDYLLNYATPTWPNPADWRLPVRALMALFAQNERRPRLEYFAELHPGLDGALEAAGFTCDSRAPVMVLPAGRLGPPPPAPLGRIRQLAGDDEARLPDYLRPQHVAYGGDGGEGALAWLPGFVYGLREGTLLVAGLEREGRFLAGAAIQMGDEVGELAGVWTDPALRRQGLAHAVCHHVLEAYFAAGRQVCWLSAAPEADGLYRRLGFVPVGTQFNYGLPAQEP